MIFLIVAFIVLAIAACFLAALGYQLMQQSGRIIERVETLEGIVTEKILSSVVAETPGLPLNSVAPNFELPDLNGHQRSLGEWRGRRILLIFFDSASHHCLKLLESLQLLSLDVPVNGRPGPLIIAIGDPDQTHHLFDGRDVDLPVLLALDAEVAAAYIVDATPSAYIISEDGLVVGGLVHGTQAVLVAAGEVGEGAYGGSAAQRLAGDKLAPQEGLKPGSQAPLFRLPKLGGGEVSLLEYRGKDTLLVFSDPDCERCVELLPELVRLADTHPGLAVVMVSRGDETANQRHAAETNGTFAIGLQRNWEVSRDYGLIATPIAYLIDEWGLVTAGVAVGNEAILALAAEKR